METEIVEREYRRGFQGVLIMNRRETMMKKILIITITVLPLFSAFSCDDQVNDIYLQQKLGKGVVAYWPIIGSSYTTQEDYSGNGYDLIIQSGTASNIVTGKFSTALNFNNSTMRGSCNPGGTILFPVSDAVSVSAWVLFNSSSGTDYDRLVENNGSYLVMYGSQIFFASPNFTVQSPPFDMIPGQWYHIVGVYNRKTVRLYVNGELSGSNDSSVSGQVPASTFYWVKTNNTGDWSGMLDEIRIYNRELSDDEIRELVTVGRDFISIKRITPFVLSENWLKLCGEL